jgi:dienelactone hydrolase
MANRNVDVLRQFVKEQDLPYFYDVGTPKYKGVCHIALPEEGHTRPGEVLFGTDSHTCTAGAFGEFATGIGNTDAGFVMGSGKLWLKVPPTMRFVFHGNLPPYLMAKDLILAVIGDIGCDGATYRAMEFDGDGVFALNIEERMTLCNMVIEAGGKNGVIAPDKVTFEYVNKRNNGQKPYTATYTDAGAKFDFEKVYDVTKMEPMIAKPHSPDNKAVLLITSVDSNAARLVSVDVATGKRTTLAEDPQFDVSFVVTHPKTSKLEAVVFLRERRDFVLLDKSLQPDFDAIKKVRAADISNISRDLADDRWIVTLEGDDAPVYYYLYERATKKATLLFSNRPALEQYNLAKVKPFEYKARDGMTIYGYLTTPSGVDAKSLAMVIFPHGGPWARDLWGYDPYAQWLANRGYAVLQPNFRSSTGYGKQYLNAGDRQWAGTMRTDLLDAKDWAVKQGVADAAKVCIMGGSYGGYATLAGVSYTPDAFACGVDIVGPSNLNTLLKTIPPYWSTLLAVFHKRMGEDEEFLKSQSPLFRADQIKAPLLIGQGANDPRVNKAESDQIVAAMRKNEKPVEYYVFPDEGHGFARPENRMAFNAASEKFLAQYLGGRFEPPSDAEKKLLESVTQ